MAEALTEGARGDHELCAWFGTPDEKEAQLMVEWMRSTAPGLFGPFYRLAEVHGCGARIFFKWPSLGVEYDKQLLSMIQNRTAELYRARP